MQKTKVKFSQPCANGDFWVAFTFKIDDEWMTCR